MESYDEDLNENPFFINLKESHPELFNQCVEERWVICVPRRESLPNYAVTIEDFFNHILKPISDSDSEERSRRASGSSGRADTDSYCGSLSSGENEQLPSNSSENSKWNFQTLSQVNAEYRSNQLINLDETDILKANNNVVNRKHLTVSILFEETFYTERKKKYKVLCIESPLHSKKMSNDGGENGFEELLQVNSLRDCIDFLWMKGKLRVLESYDAHIKLFLHNHRTLENLPVAIQRDVVHTLYLKCLNFAMTSDNPIEGSSSLQLLKVATETYVLNGVYRFLMAAITSASSNEDGHLNKIIRNLGGIHPQELDIDPSLWNNLSRARQELGKLDVHSSPLAKLTCLKKTLRHIHADTISDGREGGVLTADDLLLILVYLVVKTPLANWNAQLQYLKNFRFSVEDGNDNENTFLIATVEAALAHLKEGKVLGLAAGERELTSPCENSDTSLYPLPDSFDESGDERVAEMFNCVRTGNSVRLEEIVLEYSNEMNKQVFQTPVIDPSLLCHPLCDCEKCATMIAPVNETVVMTPVTELASESGMTLLHMACIYGRPKVVEYLISIGCPLEPTDMEGSTPLHYAASRGHQNALLLLLHAGASMEPLDKTNKTPLHLAAQNGHEGCVKALIYYAEHSRLPLNMSSTDMNGNTPLHEASRWGFQGIVQILVENGASITATNNRLATPVDCAHDIHIIRILQRSERRRSWVQSNHGDFINIEVVPREDSDGIVMLISEPNNNLSQNEESSNEDTPPKVIQPTASARQRRHSVVVPAILCPPDEDEDGSESPKQRRHSSVIPPRCLTPDFIAQDDDKLLFAPKPNPWSRQNSLSSLFGTDSLSLPRSRRQSTSTPPPGVDTPPRSRRTSSIIPPNIINNTLTIPEGFVVHHSPDVNGVDDDDFVVEGSTAEEVRRASRDESQHLRKISTESLDNIAVAILPELPAAMGVKRKRENQSHDMRKLFTTIAAGDVRLALFYLGIPADELDNPENDKLKLERVPKCHPLCPCKRCIARSAGLGLDINIKNIEGLNALHLAAKFGLTCLAKILYRYGADINIKSTYGSKSALQFAREENHSELVDFLLKHGAEE